MINAPQLRFDTEFGLYVLRPSRPQELDHDSCEMVIECGWDGQSWYRYHFIQWLDGEWYELVTRAQYNERLESIREHEGDEVADLWAQEQGQYMLARDGHPVFKMQQHWEAMMQLGLFQLHVTGDFKSKPLSNDLKQKLDVLREKHRQEELKGMDQAMAQFERRYLVTYGDKLPDGTKAGTAFVVWDDKQKMVVFGRDSKSEVIAKAQELYGFEPINGDEKTYADQVEMNLAPMCR